ncbi:MAG: hypothetical protein RIT81_34795 [Deltaproteobacteria bacterium]
MNRFQDMSTEELTKVFAESEAALRLAVFHGAEVPQEASDALVAMQEELRARRDRSEG